MAIKYNQLCNRCKKKYVPVERGRTQYVVCVHCQMKELDQDVEDPKMKKLFNIPEEMYRKSDILRSIKINYLKYGDLTEKQIAMFKDLVKRLKK